MSDEEESETTAVETPDPDAAGSDAAEASAESSEAQAENESEGDSGDATATTPEFQELEQTKSAAAGAFELSRFSGVQVVLSAELGRAQVTLEELMGLGEGAVLPLDREIGAPVELIAQGVSVGNGEVVVIEDRFAIRIKQIYQNN